MNESSPKGPTASCGWMLREGSPLPLGCAWLATQSAYNFALYSKH